MHDVWLCISKGKCARLVGQTIGWSSQVRLNAHPRMRRWMATVFAGSEDRVANRSRIVSELQLYDLPLSLPTQFSQLKVSTQGRIVKQFQLYDLLLCFQTQFLHLKVGIQDRIVKLEF